MKTKKLVVFGMSLFFVTLGAAACHPGAEDCDSTQVTLYVRSPFGFAGSDEGNVALPPASATPSPSPTTIQLPYPTIQDALDDAEKGGYCHAYVKVAAGTYTGDVTLSLPTDITGDSKDTTFVKGRISAKNLDLNLNSLTVTGVAGVGVHVNYARFNGYQLNVQGITAVSGDATSGRGIWIENATATLDAVTFTRNSGQSLVVEGPSASLKAIGLGITGNSYNPAGLNDTFHLLPAFLIDKQAQADITLLQMTSNPGVGVSVAGGAQAYFSNIDVSQTPAVDSVVGVGFAVTENSVAELHQFEFDHADGFGAFLDGGFVTGYDGKIDNNGYSYALNGNDFPAGYSVGGCLRKSNVVISGNTHDAPLQEGDLPVPNTPLCAPDQPCPTPTPPPVVPCKSVDRL